MKKHENFGFAKISHRGDPCQQNKKSAGYAGLMKGGSWGLLNQSMHVSMYIQVKVKKYGFCRIPIYRIKMRFLLGFCNFLLYSILYKNSSRTKYIGFHQIPIYSNSYTELEHIPIEKNSKFLYIYIGMKFRRYKITLYL